MSGAEDAGRPSEADVAMARAIFAIPEDEPVSLPSILDARRALHHLATRPASAGDAAEVEQEWLSQAEIGSLTRALAAMEAENQRLLAQVATLTTALDATADELAAKEVEVGEARAARDTAERSYRMAISDMRRGALCRTVYPETACGAALAEAHEDLDAARAALDPEAITAALCERVGLSLIGSVAHNLRSVLRAALTPERTAK